MKTSSSLSLDEARRLTLAAQGFGKQQSIVGAIRRLGVLQIDSVNVLVRSHYLPLFSRLGAYDMTRLDHLAYKKRSLFEYWGHQASFLPVETFPLLRWRMDQVLSHPRVIEWVKKNRALLDDVLAQVRDRGPLAASELSSGEKGKGAWWGWSSGKFALEHLFTRGQVTTHHRRNFERVYDLTERVIPEPWLIAPVPEPDDARKALLLTAAKALGVGTLQDLANYFQMRPSKSAPLVRDLLDQGALDEVSVEEWGGPAFVAAGTRLPQAPSKESALLSPFDPLVWFRERTERLFGMHYRIEIYVPAPKRVYGYYVLPYLVDEHLVARVDLKSDRKGSALQVRGAFLEPGRDAVEVARRLRPDLERMAAWLGLSSVDATSCAGDLGPLLQG